MCIRDSEWVPKIEVEQTKEEKAGVPGKRWKPGTPFPKDMIPCYDPGTLDMLGPDMPADNAEHVRIKIERARIAQKKWAKSSFKQRRLLIKTINRFVLENQDTICKVSARDSGKPLVDAAFGEVIVTLEKCKWLLKEGEKWLRPEKRSSGLMMFYKNARVEYHPVGVMGAIVPWNYPFHNVFNPLLANVFAGNALVVKVSEYASWSSLYYGRAIKECLRACGAPEDLVQIVHGYGEAGNALSASIVMYPQLRGRGKLPDSWFLLNAWHRYEIPMRAPPMPVEVLLALAWYFIRMGHFGGAVLLLIGFDCFLRTGEMLSLIISDIAVSYTHLTLPTICSV